MEQFFPVDLTTTRPVDVAFFRRPFGYDQVHRASGPVQIYFRSLLAMIKAKPTASFSALSLPNASAGQSHPTPMKKY